MDNSQSEETINTSTGSFSARPRAIDRPMSAIKKLMMQNKETIKEESLCNCPYSECGRRFISHEQLKEHIVRRHKAVEEKAKELKKEKVTEEQTKKPQQKAKVERPPPEEQKIGPEQQKILDGIMGKKPAKNPNARPATSYVPVNQMSTTFKYLKNVKDDDNPFKYQKQMRPQTAKVRGGNLMERNKFIENKLKVLENLEKTIDEDISNYKVQNTAKNVKSEEVVGITLTKKIILEKSNCDNLDQVECLILRDMKIKIVESNKDVNLDDLVNVECLYLSHNVISDLYGISTLNTLIELNLNHNMIHDVTPLEELTNLEKLFLAQNKISEISPLVKLQRIVVLSLFDNDIFHMDSTLETFESLPKLKELSVDNNPVNAKEGFKYHLIMRLNLSLIDDEKISDLDRDLAKLFYKREGIKLPEKKKGKIKIANIVQKQPQVEQENEESSYIETNKENKIPKVKGKQVKFDDLEEEGITAQEDEVRKLETKVANLLEENDTLKKQLIDKNYQYTYRENDILKAEIKNMYILMEENKDLREELKAYKSITHDERMKILKEENESMKVRIGQLLERIHSLEYRTNLIESKTNNNELK